MWRFVVGLVTGVAVGWLLDWYLSREDAASLRDELAQKNATIIRLQKELLSQQQPKEIPKRERPRLQSKEPAPPMEETTAFCVKCQEKRPIRNPRRVTLSNGRPALKGNCPVCGSGLFRLLKMQS